MSSSFSVAKINPSSIPRVLLQAKEEAAMQASKKEKTRNTAWDKGPWDKGHWANRK
jgi:hypothetical protein